MTDAYDQLTIKNIGNWVASGAIIFGGIIPYVPQYRQIKKKEDTEGFSLFGKHYEIPLLLQSICMIITMFMMIKLCVNIRNQSQIIKAKERVFTGKSVFPVKGQQTELHGNAQLQRLTSVKPTVLESMTFCCVVHSSKDCLDHDGLPPSVQTDLDASFFWKWTNFQSYLGFMVLFAAVGGILTYILVDIPIFVEAIGLLAVLTEAMLGVPQFFRNFHNKSTSGMSIAMVAMWTLGDAFKTCYFVLREAPIQFTICGILQVVIDLAILTQVYIYQNSTSVRVASRAD